MASLAPIANQTTLGRPETAPAKMRFAEKRVAMVSFSAYPFDPRPRRAIAALVDEGANIDLVCLGGQEQPTREAFGGLRILRVPLKHVRRGKFDYALRYGAFILIASVVFALRAVVRRYDMVYVHNMPDILVASALIPKILGAKVVLDLHDPMPELMMTIFRANCDDKSVRILKHLEKWSIAQADLVVTVNIACKRIFSGRSCRPEKVAVVMNSPDGRIFPFKATRRHEDTSAEKPFVLMYHGSIVERNGLEVAIDAVERLRKTVPSAHLHIFGPSTDFLDRMMRKVRDKNLDGVVRYFGARRLEELVGEIEKCDVGVIPNHRNKFTEINTPTRIFEYLALGKPVIAPSTSGILDYFSNESLLLFTPGNSDDLARQVGYAFSHRTELMEIARKGQEVYLQHAWEQERETLLSRTSNILERA
jgi:glycosyltransferase involved in cell wall biosynthesis